jgi:hypothetical protein
MVAADRCSSRGRITPGHLASLAVSLLASFAIASAQELGSGPAGNPADAPVEVRISEGDWVLETPLGAARGVLLLVRSADHGWRCEVGVQEDGPVRRDDLRARRGRGWTLVGTPEGGFVQPWSEPWRALDAAASGPLGELLAIWAEGFSAGEGVPAADVRRRWRLPAERSAPARVVLPGWDALPADWRPPSGRQPAGGMLRRELVIRGRGRGGEGAVLDLERAPASLQVTSARWPGRLHLSWSRPWGTFEVPAETFLPLWPLGDLLP